MREKTVKDMIKKNYKILIGAILCLIMDLIQMNSGMLEEIYGHISGSSLHNAASFCSLFAIVIAMIQAVYPYRLGKIHDYPISKLSETPFKEPDIAELIVISIVIIVAEVLNFLTVEIYFVLIGYHRIFIEWLYRIIKQYRKYEDESSLFIEKIEKDFTIIIKEDRKHEAQEELKEILERNINMDGINERELLKLIADLMPGIGRGFYQYDRVKNVRKVIFEYSYYFAYQMTVKFTDIELMECSWQYRTLKNAILKADYSIDSGELFVKGIMSGCLAVTDCRLARSCFSEIFRLLKVKLERDQFFELIWCLIVNQELVCNEHKENREKEKYEAALEIMQYLIASDYVGEVVKYESYSELELEDIRRKMKEIYYLLAELKFLHIITKYDVVRDLQIELRLVEKNKIPNTFAGILYARL